MKDEIKREDYKKVRGDHVCKGCDFLTKNYTCLTSSNIDEFNCAGGYIFKKIKP